MKYLVVGYFVNIDEFSICGFMILNLIVNCQLSIVNCQLGGGAGKPSYLRSTMVIDLNLAERAQIKLGGVMMKKGLRLGLVVALLIIFSLPSYAGQFGATGLLTIPTADILAPTELNLVYQRIDENGDLVGSDYGIKQGVQLGIGANWPAGITEDGEVFPKLKVKLIEESENVPAVAAGIIDRDRYIVASKSSPYYGLRAHLGVGDKERFEDNFFVGVSRVLNPVSVLSGESSFELPLTTMLAEYNGGVNLGFKFEFIPEISANLGVKDLTDRTDLTFGLSFKNEF
ncbi:YjbH domain-containing protein [Natroniella acetigena]|uniref:YjbH domain-containing protein n=1 Tax=Natroniella acetigena TaxID=52004 RepID=UPI00200B1BFC|nr:YjbH domain-containing protein [Natroniella acetigena]MCK8827782.1 YjbH domain-containing protein [Natroniella acetigena]